MIAKDLAMLVHVTHKIIKKMFRLRVAATISTFFINQNSAKVSQGLFALNLLHIALEMTKFPRLIRKGNIPSAIRTGFDAGSCAVTEGINQKL